MNKLWINLCNLRKYPRKTGLTGRGFFIIIENVNALYLSISKNSSRRKKMNKTRKDTRWLTSVALMAAIVILLANTPLGMIQLPIIKATTVHIPVILGAVLGSLTLP